VMRRTEGLTRATPGDPGSEQVRRTGVIVIGAGHSGLATAALLRRTGLEVVVLERGAIGAKWRSRYERLHLHTHRLFSMLPGLRVPRSNGSWIPRDGMVGYLEAYARHHEIDVRCGVTASRIERAAGGWRVWTDAGIWDARFAVLATGYNNEHLMPAWPGLGVFEGELLHGCEYRNYAPFVGRDVLVAGIGNTGAEIAQDLAEHGASRVRIAVRTPPHVLPRNIGPLPIQATTIIAHRLPLAVLDPMTSLISRLTIGDLSRYGLPTPRDGVFARHAREVDYVPLLDIGFVRELKAGRIEVVGAVERLEGPNVILAGGEGIAPEVLIVATGYGRGLEPLIGHLDVLDERGAPAIRRGGHAHPAAPGLHFVGFTNPTNGAVWEHAFEARRAARRIARASRRAHAQL
jgi:putative flavoprotein involved in K+ transport